ncbi:MAG: beta-lactamase family protein [Tannerella sp.]|jgi:CubicO group peptidase (beta-lactamase class C family)|nr:beta-lactamase family protein [Tannerella sp.]
MKRIVFVFILMICINGFLSAQLRREKPAAVDMDSRKLAKIADVVNESIAAGDIPGAVVGVVRYNKLVFLEAYGNKQVYPDTVVMTANTVFDLASVSKPVSTATCVMILMEQGKLRLMDDVARYIPDYQGWTDTVSGAKSPIRIVHLLTHTSGLPPYAPVEELKKIYTTPNPDGLITHISTVKRNNPPGTVFDYSCLNFISLQRIIETISGLSLQEFSQQYLFRPLGMYHTDYNPVGETLALTAPTEKQPDGSVLRGKVHDPLANIMNGGISGNAGLFSNAEDLAVYIAMILNGGQIGDVRILSPLTVKAMTRVPRKFTEFGRALGWDVYSDYEHDGDIFGAEAFGHTGYTGTSLTIDPESHTGVIILTNRVHPNDSGSTNRLRDVIANIVAGSVGVAVKK